MYVNSLLEQELSSFSRWSSFFHEKFGWSEPSFEIGPAPNYLNAIVHSLNEPLAQRSRENSQGGQITNSLTGRIKEIKAYVNSKSRVEFLTLILICGIPGERIRLKSLFGLLCSHRDIEKEN